MARLLPNKKWQCSICNKEYPTSVKADACRESHDMVYLRISKTDLSRLYQFLYTKNDKLISPELIETIGRYARKLGK